MSDKFQKLLLQRSGAQLNFGFNFQKATDETSRTVVGFATMDNVDEAGDIILAKASEEAFRSFRGNIREQHNVNSAVGRMIDFEPAEYVDVATGKVYKGIRVAVRISEGAEDTWKKCLDGTYSGFSIAGAILESKKIFDADFNKEINHITKYKLTELSLVDNPANQMANFETVYKSQGFAEKSFETKNLFWCPVHSVGGKTNDNSYACPSCGENMARIGTISDNEDIVEKLTKILADLEINMEGVITQVPNDVKKNADGVEETNQTETETVENAEAVETNAENKTEEVTNEDENAVDIESLVARLTESLQEVTSLVGAQAQKLNDLQSTVDDKLAKLIDASTNLVTKLDERDAEIKKSLTEQFTQIANSGAVQKSEDAVLTEETSDTETDEWNGIFTGRYGN